MRDRVLPKRNGPDSVYPVSEPAGDGGDRLPQLLRLFP